jgi:hypothetical protein
VEPRPFVCGSQEYTLEHSRANELTGRVELAAVSIGRPAVGGGTLRSSVHLSELPTICTQGLAATVSPMTTDSSFPIYLLELGKRWRIVFPEGMVEIGHCDFWERSVSFLVAEFFKLPQEKLLNLPYSQRRARICGNKVCYGEEARPSLLAKIRKAVKNQKLEFAYAEHEQRLAVEVRQFRQLVEVYNGRNAEKRMAGPGLANRK